MTFFESWQTIAYVVAAFSIIGCWILELVESTRQRRYHRERTVQLLIWATQQKARQERRW